MIDPIDGTHNYSQGNPNFAVNVALCHDGEPVLGLTRSPVIGEEFFATKGGGLTINGATAGVSDVATIADSVWGMDMGYDDARAAKLLQIVGEVWPGVQAVRIMGSAALGLAFAACGRYDLFVHSTLYPWDLAAGIVLIREGGGEIVARDGQPLSIQTQGVVAGASGPVTEFQQRTKGRDWR